jgi:uncharacterized membrane protein YgdD (TMEM256/DUF423 family)
MTTITLGVTAVALGAFGAHGLAKHVNNDPKKLKVITFTPL